MGVVVRRYIDILIIIITFPYSTCLFYSSIPTFLNIELVCELEHLHTRKKV